MGKRTMNRQSIVVTYTFKERKDTRCKEMDDQRKKERKQKKERTQDQR